MLVSSSTYTRMLASRDLSSSHHHPSVTLPVNSTKVKNGEAPCLPPYERLLSKLCGEYPVSLLCETLEMSVGGYYDWRKRPMSQHAQADGELAEQIQAAYHANRGLYGSPRLHVELQDLGIRCSRKRVARLMRKRGLMARRARHRTRTTLGNPYAHVAPNLLNRDFTASRPNEK